MAVNRLVLRPNSKEQRLNRWLESYADVCPAPGIIHLGGGGSKGKPGSREPRMPRGWHQAHWEIDRALARMIVLVHAVGAVRPQYRQMHDHLRDWYFRVEYKRVPTMRQKKKGGLFHAESNGQKLYHIDVIRTGDPEIVARALTWMTLEYDGDVPSFIEQEAA